MNNPDTIAPQRIDPMWQLNDPDEASRCWAAEELGYLNIAESVPMLAEHIGREPSRRVRDAIFQALLRIEADAVIVSAIQLLKHEDPSVRNQAVELLRHKGACAIPLLTEVMKQGDQHVRKLVLDVLGGRSSEDADAIYSIALSDQDKNVVITAVHTLGSARNYTFKAEIESLLACSVHPMLSIACLEALTILGDIRSLAAIRRALPQPWSLPAFFLPSYLRALGALGARLPLNELCDFLRRESSSGEGQISAILESILLTLASCSTAAACDEVLEVLFPVLRSIIDTEKPSRICQLAMQVLGHWSSNAPVQAMLMSGLASSQRYVRLGAVEVLCRFDGAEVRTLLIAHACTESDPEILALLNDAGLLKVHTGGVR